MVTKKLVTKRKNPDLKNRDRLRNIVQSLFLRVELLLREDLSSCTVQCEEFFTLENLKKAGGRLKANTALRIDGVPNEIFNEVIMVYSGILLEAFNSCLRVEKFFNGWGEQRLVLLRKRERSIYIKLYPIDLYSLFHKKRYAFSQKVAKIFIPSIYVLTVRSKGYGSDPRMRKIFSPTTFPRVSNTYKRVVSMYPQSIACLHACK